MSLSKEELIAWRDEIVGEMRLITKAPATVGTGGASTDNEKKMSLLSEQLVSVNRLLSLIDGPRALKIQGLDK